MTDTERERSVKEKKSYRARTRKEESFLEIVPGEIRRLVSRVYMTLLTSGILATPPSYDRKIG